MTLDTDKASAKAVPAGTSTLDLALRAVEYLVLQSRPVALAQIAEALSSSKATIYRHLVTLQRHGFVRQDPNTGRYDAGIKLMVLGEALRQRFDIVSAAREELMTLRDRTGQAVTLCDVIDEELIVLELIQGRTMIEFAMRPGTRLAFHASAHGKIWLAFGSPERSRAVAAGELKAWTPSTIVSGEALLAEIARVREHGWATAPDQVITGVNTLAAPVFDHRKALVGSIAIVGATQFIAPEPNPEQIREVVGAAARISRGLTWKD
ncbi:Transcriptional regulator, IclR family [Bosea sp. LC85]|uniref:IclR family transcriptional regulator n=1 Tax=Bosea sp. LC85 TaxID=1502851 RepID=UPI0004E3B689|nr:IclR family transcriptional regulator [Bosea sp. LC85]KFC75883.1 Transcriptional regulator, IclR family [Bosea sp. LC85]